MPHPPPLLLRQTLLPPQLSHPGIVDIQTQDRSCWIQPVKKYDEGSVRKNTAQQT